MTAATPENLQNIFSDVNELAQNSLRQLGFDPEYYPWEMIDQVQAKIAEDWPDAQGHPYNTIPMNRLRDDLAAMDGIEHLDPDSRRSAKRGDPGRCQNPLDRQKRAG